MGEEQETCPERRRELLVKKWIGQLNGGLGIDELAAIIESDLGEETDWLRARKEKMTE